MSPVVNTLACLMSLAFAMFLWRGKISLLKESCLILCFFIISCIYTILAAGVDNMQIEHYPFKMLALCFCFSTTALPHKRRRYLVLAQAFWLWVELFGGISLAYRGFDFLWTRPCAIFVIGCCCSLLSKITKEMEFCLMVFWIAIWIFF